MQAILIKEISFRIKTFKIYITNGKSKHLEFIQRKKACQKAVRASSFFFAIPFLLLLVAKKKVRFIIYILRVLDLPKNSLSGKATLQMYKAKS